MKTLQDNCETLKYGKIFVVPPHRLFLKSCFLTLRIGLPGHLQGVRRGQVLVSRGHRQDEASVPADELHDHVVDLRPDVRRLVPHRDLCHARQVDQCDVQD